MAPALALATPISLIGRLRIAVRLTLMLAALLVALPIHVILEVVTGRSNIPGRFLGAVTAIAGIRVSEHGTQVKRGAFFIANHVSWIDIPALAGSTRTAFVGHDGLAAMPVLRWLCSLNDTVFVARHDRRSVTRQAMQVANALDENNALAIFPEGTTSDGTGLLPFKSSLLSAFEPVPPGVSVQPVYLDYAEVPQIAWVGEEPGLDNFLRILARRHPVYLTLHFLPPLAGAQLADRKTIAAAAQQAIARTMAERSALS